MKNCAPLVTGISNPMDPPFFSNLLDLFVSLFWPMIVNVFVAFHERELSFLRCCS